jgi:plastocyanin
VRRLNPHTGVAVALAVLSMTCGPGDEVASGPLNGCDPASALDRRGEAEVEIRFGELSAYRYEPSCLWVDAGTRVRFVGDFAVHPLAPGAVRGGALELDPDGPIRETSTGDEATFHMAEVGRFGYFCNTHLGEGMTGAVFVE